jgi:rhomboid protease GluP
MTDKLSGMFKRQRTGSVVCASCGSLVGVNDDVCYSCGRRNPGLWGFGRSLREFGHDLGFVTIVMYGCGALYLATLLFSAYIGEGIGSQSPLSMLGPGYTTLIVFGASGIEPVFRYGRWWSFLSAGWLHAGILHLVFNMMTLRQLGPPTAEVYGPARMVIIYVLGGVVGFICSTLAGAIMPPLPIIGAGSMTIGASAPIFGLLGGLMYYSRRGGSSLMRSAVMGYVMSAVVMGILMPRIDNWAHAGGFAGGYLAGIWLDPLKPERMDHMMIAAACLIASGLAVAASVLAAFWPYIMIQFFGAPPGIVR